MTARGSNVRSKLLPMRGAIAGNALQRTVTLVKLSLKTWFAMSTLAVKRELSNGVTSTPSSGANWPSGLVPLLPCHLRRQLLPPCHPLHKLLQLHSHWHTCPLLSKYTRRAWRHVDSLPAGHINAGCHDATSWHVETPCFVRSL